MLPEVISGNIGLLDVIAPIRRLCCRGMASRTGLGRLGRGLGGRGLPNSTRDTLTALYAYVERHRDHIDYAHDKDLGLPMGSGHGRG